MKILLDECVDWRLVRDLSDHDASTVKQAGLESAKDGSLIRRATAEFDVLISVDKDLPKQQNIRGLDIIVVVLRGRTTRLADLRSLVPSLRQQLATARAGEFVIVDWRDLP